jgi:hypothetical protein
MRRITQSLLAVIVLLATSFSLAEAAPPQQACYVESRTARDMAGTYTSPTMTLVVHPCGGIYLEWQNTYGVHDAAYAVQTRVAGEGIIALSDAGNDRRLDSSTTLGVKAAERGYVQVITINDYTKETRVYRLRKIS